MFKTIFNKISCGWMKNGEWRMENGEWRMENEKNEMNEDLD